MNHSRYLANATGIVRGVNGIEECSRWRRKLDRTSQHRNRRMAKEPLIRNVDEKIACAMHRHRAAAPRGGNVDLDKDLLSKSIVRAGRAVGVVVGLDQGGAGSERVEVRDTLRSPVGRDELK